MDDNIKELWTKVKSGEFDINNQQLFFSIVAKGFIYKLNQNLKLRDKFIPHFILNTGDDILYLEVKGQDHSIEPVDVSNENFVYSQIPRCMVQPAGINIPTDQLTNPYAHGSFQVDDHDMTYTFRAEFRRIPIVYTFHLKYYFDSFTDSLDVVQQIISNLAFINRFNVSYLGQKIECSYNIPDSDEIEYMMEFDGITTDQKTRTLSIDLEVQTNMPVVYRETAIPANMVAKTFILGEKIDKSKVPGPEPEPDKIYMKPGFRLYPKDGIERHVEGEMSSDGKIIKE